MGFVDWLLGGPKKKKKSKKSKSSEDDWERKEEDWKQREAMWKEKEEKIRMMQERILAMEERRRRIEAERKKIEVAIETEKEKKARKTYSDEDYEDEYDEDYEDEEDYEEEVPVKKKSKKGKKSKKSKKDKKAVKQKSKRAPKRTKRDKDLLKEHDMLDQEEESEDDEVAWEENTGVITDAPELEKPRLIGVLPNLTFENFVVGENNRFPYVAAQSVAQAPARAYNPLFIWGDVGLGKTHLLQSIANFIAENNPEAKVLYCSSEKFTNELIRAVETSTINDFRDKYRNIDCLLIDDIQFISGKENTQEEFFHTFNELYNNSKQIVISSDRPPSEIHALEKRLRSRFEGGLITQMKPPSEDIRVAILRSKIQDMNIYIPDEVIRHIASMITTNVRELQGGLNRVKAFASMTGGPINLENARKALEDMIPAQTISTEPVVSEQPQRVAEDDQFSVGSASDMDLIRQLEKEAGSDLDMDDADDFDLETKRMEDELMRELKKQGVDFR